MFTYFTIALICLPIGSSIYIFRCRQLFYPPTDKEVGNTFLFIFLGCLFWPLGIPTALILGLIWLILNFEDLTFDFINKLGKKLKKLFKISDD